jgi:glycosyltransferase involved in cell wall biosynthesis
MNDTVSEITTISVVTPSYNQGRFLSETIESVIGQAGDFQIDYIIVDGASTDNSVEIIQRYERLLNNGEWPVKCQGIRYRWLSEEDAGQANAIMKGFKMAEGEIFAWLNSDDTYLPEAMQTSINAFHETPDTGLIYGDSYYRTTEGAIISRDRSDHFNLNKLACFNIVCQPSAFFRRDVFEAVGGLDEKLYFVMDFDLWIRIGKLFPCRYFPRFLSVYRLHETSKTINSATLIRNSEESLEVTLQHFGWAPLTRVYTSCSIMCKANLPMFLAERRVLLAFAAIACTMFRYLKLNRGFNRNDLKFLTCANIRKLFKSRFELMTGGTA